MIENQKINNSIINNIQLSEGAINFLDNQILKNGESKVLEASFTFQIIHAIKNISNWYCCSLLDRNSKFGGFCIKYENQYGEPKKGDIIQTNKIQIIKLPNRETNLYFCTDVKKVNQSKKMIIDPKKLDSVSKKRSSSKKNPNLNDKLLENINKNIFIGSHNKSSVNSDKNGINMNNMQSRFTLISNLDNFTNNPTFLLKCRHKNKIREYINKRTNKQSYLQEYLFYDTNGDEIQGIAYDKYALDYNEVIKEGSVYQIYKADRYLMNPNFQRTECQIQLIFKNFTKIEEVKDNGEFQNFKKKEFTIIGQLSIDQIYHIINVRGIILEDRGTTEKRKENDKSVMIKRLIIGDDSFHKINVMLFNEKIERDKKYSKGEIITIYYIKFHKYINYYNLNCNNCTEIGPCDDQQREKELKDFYNKHPYPYEYKDISYVILNSLKNIQFKFLQDTKDDYILEYNGSNYNMQKLIKINGTIINFNHNETNFYECCVFCNKKYEDVCPNCLIDRKKLIVVLNVEISDCTGNLWIEFSGEIAENFIGTNVEEYAKFIKDNDSFQLNKINQRILYHNYSFIGKYKYTFGEDNKCLFYVLQFNENDKNYFKELLVKLKDSI